MLSQETFLFFLSQHGRINRVQWWRGMIALILLTLIGGPVLVGVFVSPLLNLLDPALKPLGGMLTVIFMITGTWAYLALSIKRLHDRGQSGWGAIVAHIPVIGSIWLWIGAKQPIAAVMSLIPGVSFLWLFIELGFLGSDPRSNAYDFSQRLPNRQPNVRVAETRRSDPTPPAPVAPTTRAEGIEAQRRRDRAARYSSAVKWAD